MGILRPLLAMLARISPISRYIVEGPSMEPAYHPGDRLIVNRLAYVRHAPAYGDVVVLRDPDDDARLLIKRIAASPDGGVSGPSRVWVLGDNADESRDSRSFGSVDRRSIVGKAWLRY